MSRFNPNELQEWKKRITDEMIAAHEALQVKCPDEPETKVKGDEGAESEGPSHDDKVLRARNTLANLRKLEACDAALVRIHNGTFGICVQCKGDIQIGRLNSSPTTPFCIDCKMENDEKKGELPKIGPRREVSYIYKAA